MTLKSLGLASLLAGLLLAPSAQAQPPHRERGASELSDMQTRFERKARLIRLVAISDALGLSDADALKLDKTLQKYDAQRRPLQQTILEGVQILRRAARGDQSAFAQVDATLQKMVQARANLHAIDFEMFQELAKGRSPQERAKLALVMARLPTEMRAMARGQHGGRHHGGDVE
jgi:hypothetical protein